MLHPLREILQAVRQLPAIFDPISQGAIIRIPLAEPSVIQYEQLNAELAALLRNRLDLVGIEIEIRRLPVINENRTLQIAMHAPAKSRTV
ncbi:hypothetical protein D3C77_400610 [compost metagenome]